MTREPPAGPSGLVEHYFRHEYGRLVASLTRRFGLDALARVEDAVQEALLTALTAWSLKGVARDPGAWLYQVAFNTLRDQARRDGAWRRASQRLGDGSDAEAPDHEAALRGEIPDDELRMLFVCCDHRLPAPSQLALALKVLCGFSVREVALRLLTTEENVYKRLNRARETLREAAVDLDTPPDIAARLPAVHAVLYLLFNEGYCAASGASLVRHELCREALRLAHMLLRHEGCDTPAGRALVALFHLQCARLGTRVDAAGELLTLAEQDRTCWDREEILLGLRWLQASAAGGTFSRYHAEAAIAAEHALAPSCAETRWEEIAELYAMLDRQAPSPLNALNRAVALAEARGAQAGLDSLEGVRLPPGIAGYYLWDAVVGDLLRRVGRDAQARVCLSRALQAAPTEAERALLRRRLTALDGGG